MAETITFLNDERRTDRTQSAPHPLELNVLTTLGTLRFAAPSAISVQEPGSGPWVAPLFIDTRPTLPPFPRRRHISSRCYDIAFAILILASAAVALYLLIWMGQP